MSHGRMTYLVTGVALAVVAGLGSGCGTVDVGPPLADATT